MFYKLVEREANSHLNVPMVSFISVWGLFYKHVSGLVQGDTENFDILVAS